MSSTSHLGGSQVDGLPPASSIENKHEIQEVYNGEVFQKSHISFFTTNK